MNKFISLLALFLSIFLLNSCATRHDGVVQETVIVQAPMWAPMGYGNARFLFIPDMMVYYDLQSGLFMYPRGRRWISQRYLPRHFNRFDLYNTHVVVINNYFGPSPYQYFNQHTNMYPVGFRGQPYQTIGSRGQDNRRYFRGNNATDNYGRGEMNNGGRQATANTGRRGNQAATSSTRGGSATNSRSTNGQRNETTRGTDRNNNTVNQEASRGQRSSSGSSTRSQSNRGSKSNATGSRSSSQSQRETTRAKQSSGNSTTRQEARTSQQKSRSSSGSSGTGSSRGGRG